MHFDLETLLSPETLEKLRVKAEARHITLDDALCEAIDVYIDDEDAYEDTPDEKILDDLKAAWREVLQGHTTAADEALAMLHNEFSDDDESD